MKPQKEIIRIIFGSHLYGTNTPQSDQDFKAVHLPSASDILLQKAHKVQSKRTKFLDTIKNTAGDVDFESYPLLRMLDLLEAGDTYATEILFAPSRFMLNCTDEWFEILGVRHRLLNGNCAGYVGYCRKQAAKYGIKGSRVACAREALSLLQAGAEVYGGKKKLIMLDKEIKLFVEGHEHSSLELTKTSYSHHNEIPHFVVCGRMLPYPASIDSAIHVVERLVKNYGDRALMAEKNEGVDWKAMSHAVRVGRQAIELLTTGNLIFPRPEAAHLLEIRKGERPYLSVAEELEELLAEVEKASQNSVLPAESDKELMVDLVHNFYRQQVI